MTPDVELARLHAALGLKRLRPAWAKLEILLGLAAAGAGVYLLCLSAARPPDRVGEGAGGLALFTLGGYLALAGHRSHLYQSSNLLAAYLAGAARAAGPDRRGDTTS